MKPTQNFELIQIRDAQDVCALTEDLQAAGLPEASADRVALFKFVGPSRAALGYAGLEGEGPEILLRSFVVRGKQRGAGIGSAMLKSLLAEARRKGAKRVWLLTTTAADFFAKNDFQKIARAAAPSAISATEEFASVCPATAICMWREL